MTYEDKKARDRKLKIEPAQYKAARKRLILSRATHLDQLADKLQEPRVHNVISALLSSEQTELQIARDDMEYVADLGLIRHKPYLQIANRIYQEIIPLQGPEQRIVIELKILRGGLETLLPTALAQTYEYADKCSADEVHIIIFNRDPNIPWEQKIWHRQESYKNTNFLIWGC